MATATQLMPSPGGLKSMSAFSPYTDSPSSPAPATFTHVFSNRSSTASDHLQAPPSPYPSIIEPSPVDSNGTVHTEITEIEDSAQVNHVTAEPALDVKSPDTDEIVSPASSASQASQAQPQPFKLNTALPKRVRGEEPDSDEPPPSVIHAPSNFKQFDALNTPSVASVPSSNVHTTENNTADSPSTPEAHHMLPRGYDMNASTHAANFIDTAVSQGPPDRSTPRAQTRQDFEEATRRRSAIRMSANLDDIAENEDGNFIASSASSSIDQDDSRSQQSSTEAAQTMGEALQGINQLEKEVVALRSALDECWTLCNSLAKLSQHHRQRMFHYSGGRADIQEHAWRTCWRLCQRLYESRDEHPSAQIMPTLELCRDFCQALFDVRSRGDEASDSVLRVSFELNNHLYNAHDRSLPETFRERTLDFYLTLCHRLMKQRTSLPEETDSLLHACWSLAEMLFSLRQNSRDGRPGDEELLGSAIQACWELCDLFREGWTQVRPDRATPRPTQATFSVRSGSIRSSSTMSQSHIAMSERSGRSSSLNQSYHSAISSRMATPAIPETPTTIFDDREGFSPADEPNAPNILVLGPEAGMTRTHDRWSSASSNLSTYSDASVQTSSTATAGREDANLIRLKGLIVKAAINTGYTRLEPLPEFIRALPSNSFGSASSQIELFENYRKLVLADPLLRSIHMQPLRRLTAEEIGRAVVWMGRSGQFKWLRELYRFVFGTYPEDEGKRNLIINA